jgi:hypothetical protein
MSWPLPWPRCPKRFCFLHPNMYIAAAWVDVLCIYSGV